MTIGIINQDGRAVFGYGRMSQRDPRVPGADTIFEIGSITTAFTGVLLADIPAIVGSFDIVMGEIDR